jgi:hypothetical protein
VRCRGGSAQTRYRSLDASHCREPPLRAATQLRLLRPLLRCQSRVAMNWEMAGVLASGSLWLLQEGLPHSLRMGAAAAVAALLVPRSLAMGSGGCT